MRAFLIELPVYAVLVVIYFLLVLHLLADWLGALVKHHIALYALIAIALVIGQALLLDWVTSMLMYLLRRRTK